jgi:hypothetical protein
VVEAGRSQSFFVQLSQKDRQITVRLLPATDPEKTTGVKRVMALIAMQLHESPTAACAGDPRPHPSSWLRGAGRADRR